MQVNSLDQTLENTQENAQEVLATHGKSFRFAQLFLDKTAAKDAARLYQFCRILDDVVDEGTPEFAQKTFAQISEAMKSRESSMPWLQDYFSLQATYALSQFATQDLFSAIYGDLQEVKVNNETELLEYCYGVAGTVGCLMRPILKAPKAAEPFAIDLGIAMQLTNIARDVLEDAKNERVYIPGTWINHMSAADIIKAKNEHQMIVQQAVRKLLDMADTYYQSAKHGIMAIPAKNRLGIAVAMVVYREIGEIIQENNFDYQRGRMFVPTLRKCRLALSAWWHYGGKDSYQLPAHSVALHKHIRHKLSTEYVA